MILRWIRSILTTQPEDISRHVPESIQRRKDKNDQLVDIAHEALRTDAHDLEKLIKLGQPEMKRRKLRENIRRKVKKNIAPQFDEPEIVEEVTERILNAAEFDPHYKEMFDDKA